MSLMSFIFNMDAQSIKKVLFIGNSYTYVNDLPALVTGIASSLGDSMYHDIYAPGGYTFQMHSLDPNTRAKINSDQWDVVVLQEQSQLPALWPDSVAVNVFPYADSLNGFIKANDSCTTTLFYMTWGRKNGDMENCPYYPPVCTYEGMQARLRQSYLEMGQMLNAEVSPVGISWKLTRTNNPAIELYNLDESHPSIHGSYLAACTFYEAIFHKSPVGAAFPSGISSADAAVLQENAHSIVYDSLDTWQIDTSHVYAAFHADPAGNMTFLFTNQSLNAASYYWDFGDGDHSSDTNPVHQFASSGTFAVKLYSARHCQVDSTFQELLIVSLPENEEDDSFAISPNPGKCVVSISCSFLQSNKNITYIMYSGSGKAMLTGVLDHSPQLIDVSRLPDGLYFLTLRTGNRTITRKIELR